MAEIKTQSKTKVQPTNNLGRLFSALRYAERKTLRDIGAELGIGASTLLRLEQGHIPDGQTTKKLLIWLFEEHTNA